jgi:hypothetical protein
VAKRPRRTYNGHSDTIDYDDIFGPLDNFDDIPNIESEIPIEFATSNEYGDTAFAGEHNPYEVYPGDHRIKYSKYIQKKKA